MSMRTSPILVVWVVVVVLLAAAMAHAQTPPTARELFAFETIRVPILFPPDKENLLRDLGLQEVIDQLENGEEASALVDASLMGLRVPALWDEPTFRLVVAEIYFRLGVDDPAIHAELALPLYRSLMNRYPRWINQPLVAFRLATLLSRLGYDEEAISHYGLLIDWYPDSPFVNKARLGLAMTELREGRAAEAEALTNGILSRSKDAQVLFHATVARGMARHLLGRDVEAWEDFQRSVKWPEDLELLQPFEVFGYGATAMAVGDRDRARDVFVTYLRRYPESENRAMAVFTLAEIARDRGDFPEAITGYTYLIREYGDQEAGVQARLDLAALRVKAFPHQPDPTAEALLRQVADNVDYPHLRQTAALRLARYYIDTGQPLQALRPAAFVFDNPLEVRFAATAIEEIGRAFNDVVDAETGRPDVVAEVFEKYRRYLTAAGVPPATYEKLIGVLLENMQFDSAFALCTAGPLAERYPLQAAFGAARAERGRGHLDAATAHLAAAIRMLEKDEAKDAPPNPEVFTARLLWADILGDDGQWREALRQIALARADAAGPLDEGRLELAAGSALFAQGAHQAAAERLGNAVRLLGEPTDAEPLAGWQRDALYRLGESAYATQNYDAAAAAFKDLLARHPAEDRAAMAAMRLAEIRSTQGESVDAPEGALPPEFWPGAKWRVEDYLHWWGANESRFGDAPDWGRMP